ncbi:MAG: manganese efflux pump [Bacteroidales bacterium]|nr:manganese efflux pump [Candidatus Colicola faecequi]
MDLLSIIFIGIGLAMDCFAVSTTKGICASGQRPAGLFSREHLWGWAVLMAFFFGAFQGGMPLIGYFAGTFFMSFFSRFAPWIALALLGFIGGKMIWESLHEEEEEESSSSDRKQLFSLGNLLVLAVATSIDALATGVIFIPCPDRLWIGVGIIAFTSFLFSLVGYGIGLIFGKRFHFNVELLGGIILVLIGLKIWIEGIFF